MRGVQTDVYVCMAQGAWRCGESTFADVAEGSQVLSTLAYSSWVVSIVAGAKKQQHTMRPPPCPSRRPRQRGRPRPRQHQLHQHRHQHQRQRQHQRLQLRLRPQPRQLRQQQGQPSPPRAWAPAWARAWACWRSGCTHGGVAVHTQSWMSARTKHQATHKQNVQLRGHGWPCTSGPGPRSS